MINSKFFQFEHRQVIEEYCKAGKPYSEIAEHPLFKGKFSAGGIKQEVQRCGGKVNYNALIAHERRLAALNSRKWKLRKVFTAEQKELIRRYAKRGYTKSRIRGNIGCCHKKLNDFMESEGIKISDKTSNTKSLEMFEERLNRVEEQLRILTEKFDGRA